MLKQVEPHLETPETLLQTLAAEAALRRAQPARHRLALLAGGVVLILGGATVALCALFSSLHGMSRGEFASQPNSGIISQR